MTTTTDEIRQRDAVLRAELQSALERERIVYPPDRLDDAVVEYGQLKRLMALVAEAVFRAAPATTADSADRA